MSTITPIVHRSEAVLAHLLDIWTSSVSETHHFLDPGEIARMTPQVLQALAEVEHLYGWHNQTGELLGFIGVQGRHIEMLFIHASARGQGAGRRLIEVATGILNADTVDVNEDNTQGVGFYQRMGFVQTGRSDTDSEGRPYPLLHMELKRA